MTRRESRLGALRDVPSFAQKSAEGVVAVKAGKAGWSENLNGVPEWARVSSGRVNRAWP